MESERWTLLCDGVDREVSGLWERYAATGAVTAGQIAAGFSNLAELRQGREPAYAADGTGAAYVLVYMVQRTASLVLAFDAAELPSRPLRILDIGAGTGATAVALRVIERREDAVTFVEPNAGMRSFIALKPELDECLEATMEDVLSQATLGGERYDLIVLSACLPYGWRPGSGRGGEAEFGAALRNRLLEGGQVILIEPPAKAAQVEIAVRAFELVDMAVERISFESLVDGGSPRRLARETSASLEQLHRRLLDTGLLSRAGEDLLGPPWAITTTAASADLALVARTRDFTFRPVPRERFCCTLCICY